MSIDLKHKVGKIIHKLNDLSVYHVVVGFDGQGDSGEIHEVEAYGKKNFHNLIDLDEKMYKQIEDYIYDVIENNVCADGYDWYNNDGGWGTVHIYPETKEIKIEYHQRTTEDINWDVNILSE